MLPAILLSLLLINATPIENRPADTDEYLAGVSEYIDSNYKNNNIPELIMAEADRLGVNPDVALAIAKCESGLRQFSGGNVLKGVVNSKDIGLFQINEKYHLDTSVKLDYDIYTTNGNIKYAIWLMSKEGTAPWALSKHCWN
jgi:hypothetical protein